MRQITTTPDESPAAGWERTLYAFLAEKERRSGSLRTVQGYSRMLRDFLGRLAKTPDEITSQDVFTWAYGTGSRAESRPRKPFVPTSRASARSADFSSE